MINYKAYMIAEEGLFDKLKENKRLREENKQKLEATIAELKSLSPEEVATRCIKALNSKNLSNGLSMISKEPEAKQLVQNENEIYQKNPGKINPTTTKMTTIAGFPVLVVTRKNKKTGEEEFAQVLYAIKFLKDFNYAGKILKRAGEFDVDVVSGYTQVAKILNA